MASLGLSVSAALLGLLFLTALTLSLQWSSAPVRVLHPALSTAFHRSISIRSTKIFISDVNIDPTGQTVALKIYNRGSSSFRSIDVARASDLILYYVAVDGSPRVIRLAYDPDLSARYTWRVENLTTNGELGEALNPSNPPALTKGSWDPYEELEAKLYLDPPLDPSQPMTIVFASPNGFTSQYSSQGGG